MWSCIFDSSSLCSFIEREKINNVICKCLKVWCAVTLVIDRMSYCVYILLDPNFDPICFKVSKPCLGLFLLMWIDLLAASGVSVSGGAAQDCSCSSIIVCSVRCSALFRVTLRGILRGVMWREQGQKQGLTAGVFIIDLCGCWCFIWLGCCSELTHSGIWNRIITWVWCSTFLCPCHIWIKCFI